jgi:hypothetical protein
MTRLSHIALTLSLCGLLATGCPKEQPTDPGKKEGKTEKTEKTEKAGGATTGTDPLSKLVKKVEDKVAGALAVAKDERKALTPAQYEALIVSLATCKLVGRGIDESCAEYKAYREARSRNTMIGDMAGQSSTLGLKHINHASPAVRYIAAGLLRSFFGSKPDVQEAVLKAADGEKEPVVLAALIGAVGSSAKSNPKVGELLIKMADHADEGVRVESLGWLASSWGKDVPGAVDKVIEKIQKDESIKVRRAACESCGRMGAADKLFPVLKKLTKNADNPDLYSSCMRGLLDLWNPFLSSDAPPSKEAYTLSLARLRDKPRSKDRPPWIVISNYGRVPKSNPPWYKQQQVAKALADVAIDEQANWMARTAAARALGELKAVEQLNQIKSKLADKTDFDNKNVVKAADEGLAKAK